MPETASADQQTLPVPLLRDPPPPPGYVDPLEGCGLLQEPFADPGDDGAVSSGSNPTDEHVATSEGAR